MSVETDYQKAADNLMKWHNHCFSVGFNGDLNNAIRDAYLLLVSHGMAANHFEGETRKAVEILKEVLPLLHENNWRGDLQEKIQEFLDNDES